MTEDKNPQPQERGFFSSLESAKKQRRAFHIPTAPAAAVRLVQNLNRKGASSTTVQTLPQAHPSIGKDSDLTFCVSVCLLSAVDGRPAQSLPQADLN